MNKFEIRIFFDPSPKGKLFDLQMVKLKTKKTTWKRAQELAEIEDEKYGWPYTRLEVEKL